MSVWQFDCALAGYIDANTPDEGGMSKAEQDAVWAWMLEKDAVSH